MAATDDNADSLSRPYDATKDEFLEATVAVSASLRTGKWPTLSMRVAAGQVKDTCESGRGPGAGFAGTEPNFRFCADQVRSGFSRGLGKKRKNGSPTRAHDQGVLRTRLH